MTDDLLDLGDPDDVAVLEDFVERQEDELKHERHKHKEHDHE